jgi:hypothetical protein
MLDRYIIRLLVIVLPLCGTASGSTVVFDNLANLGNPYLAGVGFGAVPIPGVFQYIAEQFSVSGSFTLDSIELPISVAPYAPDQVDAFLMSDSAGLPSSVLEMFHLTGVPATSPHALTSVGSVLHPLLTAGTPYWVAITGGTPTSFGTWDLVSAPGRMAARDITNGIDGGWSLANNSETPTLALRVNADSVPEPDPSLLVSAGLIFLACIGVHSKRGHSSAVSG